MIQFPKDFWVKEISGSKKIPLSEISEFRKTILDYYAVSGRSFPWRYTSKADPWGVLVSEFMLQQTQTSRVLSYWDRWMKKWPTPSDLALAPLALVMKEWVGLGYNRRAKNLRDCAVTITEKHGGIVPNTAAELITLPGIGAYTAGAVACFAWNSPEVFIETNIRSVFLHFFFQDKTEVNDKELFPILEQTLDHENPKIWYWALMDYGAELKKLTRNPSRKSAHYAKQSRFEGSFRQIRGAVVKTLSVRGPLKTAQLLNEIKSNLANLEKSEYYRALETLEKEKIVAEKDGIYSIN